MTDRNLRIVFMGTPAFAIPCLQYLVDAGYKIVGVITAPDKPGGRGLKQMISSPVKQFAGKLGLTVLQPTNLKSTPFLNQLRELACDLQVVVAFRMLPEVVWNMPSKGTINLHGSLLPAFRGAAPIQWAVIRGERKTGLTTFLLQHEIDTGAILLQYEIPILDDDDTAALHDRMMYAGGRLIVATADLIAMGEIAPHAQDMNLVSHAPKINHEDGRIHWDQPAIAIHNLVRGMSSYPGAWTMLDGHELKIFKSRVLESGISAKPGKLQVEDKSLIVQTGNNRLELLEVQMTGKKRMKTTDFLNGYRIRDWSLT